MPPGETRDEPRTGGGDGPAAQEPWAGLARPPIAATAACSGRGERANSEVLDMGVPDRRRPALLTLGVLVAALTLVLAACGGSASQVLSAVGNSVGGEDFSGGAAASEAPAAEAPEGQGQVRSDDGANPPSALRDDLKIVYTGSLQLVVDDLQAALAKAKAAVAATGGYIGASQESNDDDHAVATITYRIPATRWEDAIDSLRGLAIKVVAEQTQATEVGGQIVDLEARIRNLRASEASLVEIAKGAGRISDLLEVEAQLDRGARPDRAARGSARPAPGPGGLRHARDDLRHRGRAGPADGAGLGPGLATWTARSRP